MRQYITPDVLANQVRMQRAAFAGAFVFVEGVSDERFYSLFLDPQSCTIIISHGRPQVLAVCAILDHAGFVGFIGIVDADFDHVAARASPSASVVLTDYHDAECYLIASDALDRVLHEHADRDKLSKWKTEQNVQDVCEHFVEQCAEIGFLLWHSLTIGIGLNFNGLALHNFITPITLVVESNALIAHVLALSGGPAIDPAQLATQAAALKTVNLDLLHVARGHDIVDLLCFALRETWTPDNANLLSSKTMESVLRTAYPDTAFSSTKLCGLIKAWETSHHGTYRILNSKQR